MADETINNDAVVPNPSERLLVPAFELKPIYPVHLEVRTSNGSTEVRVHADGSVSGDRASFKQALEEMTHYGGHISAFHMLMPLLLNAPWKDA